MRPTLALSIVAMLSACTVGPDYRRPEVSAPATWRLGSAEAGEISNAAWWEQFQDPALSNLIRTAIESNKDLAIATANVDQAFAQYGITRSALFPQVDSGASAARQRSSESGPVPVIPGRPTLNDYDLHLSASFELDLWGRLRRPNEAAPPPPPATHADPPPVVLTLVTPPPTHHT